MAETAATAGAPDNAAGAGPAPADIAYAIRPCTADAAQLADWHGTATSQNLLLDGLCPACAHDSPQAAPLKVTALEAHAVRAGPVRIPVTLTCNCSAERAGAAGNPQRRVRAELARRRYGRGRAGDPRTRCRTRT